MGKVRHKEFNLYKFTLLVTDPVASGSLVPESTLPTTTPHRCRSQLITGPCGPNLPLPLPSCGAPPWTSNLTSLGFDLLNKRMGQATSRSALTPRLRVPCAGHNSSSGAPVFCFPKQRSFQMWAEPSSPRPLPPRKPWEECRGRDGPQPVIAINRDLKHRLLKIPGWRPIKAHPGPQPSTSPTSARRAENCPAEPAEPP